MAANRPVLVAGNSAPSIKNIPPTIMIPETAFVTDMRGLCKAGVTPQTTWYPTMPAKAKVLSIFRNSGSGAVYPNASAPNIQAEVLTAFNHASLYGSATTTSFLWTAAAGYYNSDFEVTIGGGGHFNSPFSVTILYLTTSSSKSTPLIDSPSLIVPAIYDINFEILFAYKVELYVGNLLGKSVYPIILTPLWLYNSPGLVNSQFPPVSAAKSTIMDPCFIFSTNSFERSFGAGLPGIKAVVIIISTSLAYFINNAISAS